MNQIILMGRLTKDPEVRYGNGVEVSAVARFSIAVDRRFKKDGQPTADFFTCVAFGKTAEVIEKYFSKGKRILLNGTLQNNNWEDKSGVKHYDMQIVVENIDFVESKGSGSAEQAPATDADGFMQIPVGVDEDLPFA